MIRALNLTTTPAELVAYFDSNRANPEVSIRRRSALVRSQQSDWVLALSVVQAFPDLTLCPSRQESRSYDDLQLLEDWLSPQQARSFADAIEAGTITLDQTTLVRSGNPLWQSELVSPPNTFMDRVGFVVQTRFEARPIAMMQDPLISLTAPYYPDTAGAVQDWAGLIQHHGYNDGRNGHIVFLLPEARAFFCGAVSDNGVLQLTLSGSDIGRTSFLVKGAYWQNGTIHHFEGAVAENHIDFPVPNEVERLEYVLLGANGEVYDLQREAWGRPSGLTRSRTSTADDALIQQILNAQELGEGEEIEFKPFLDPDEPLGSVRGKSKFREILRTIAAFANTNGGSIFLGVSDDCSVGGIHIDLAKWHGAEVSDDIRNRYKGALTNKIRGELLGDCRFWMAFAELDDATVAIISVSRFESAPVGLRDEGLCYVRRGASNRFLSPHEWHTIFGQNL